MLHLQGYDHDTDRTRARDGGARNRDARGLGIADPYAGHATAFTLRPAGLRRRTTVRRTSVLADTHARAAPRRESVLARAAPSTH